MEIQSDIYGDIPDRDFDDILFELRIGKTFMIHVQRQHGFVRAACYTSSSNRWLSPILVDDRETFKKLLADVCDEVIDKSDPGKLNKLKIVRE
jgi:hypothetical protein